MRMHQRLGSFALGCAVVAGWAGRATADSFVEGAIGIAAPFAGDEYDRHVNNSLKLGVRAGSMVKHGGGVELAIDFTPYDDNLSSFSVPFATVGGGIWRLRGLLGGRYTVPIGKTAHAYGRAGLGIDVVHVDVNGTTFVGSFDQSQTDVGLGLEVAGGITVDLGSLEVGAQLGLPMGFHFNGDDPNDTTDFDLEYNAFDLDFLFTAGTRM